MLSLRDLVERLAQPPGDLVYYLVTLFAIQLILGIAFSHWYRHRRDAGAVRLLLASVGLALVRVTALVVAVLDRVGVLPALAILPPLERFLDFSSIVLALWAFLSLWRRHPRLGVSLLLVSLLGGMILYAATAALWLPLSATGQAYSGTDQATLWEGVSVGLLVLGLVATLAWRGDNWGLLTCLLGVWLAGHALQLADWQRAQPVHPTAAAWARLADLVALPVLAALAYHQALRTTPLVVRDIKLELFELLEMTRRLERGHDAETALKMIAPAIARTLDVDMVAIGLLAPGAHRKVRVVALHPSTGVLLTNQELFLEPFEHLMLATALKTGQMQRAYAAPGERDASGRQSLQRIGHDPLSAQHQRIASVGIYQRLGFASSGPLMVQPLVNGAATLGVLMAGNPLSQRLWAGRDEQLLQGIGAALAKALAGATRRAAAPQVAEPLPLQAEREAERVAELEAALQEERERAEELAARLRFLERDATAGQSPAEVAIWQQEVRNLAEACARLETELEEWKAKAERLEQARAELGVELARAQSEARAAHSQPIVATELVAGTLGGILLSDETGRIVLASQGAQRLVGRERASLIGASTQELFSEPYWVQAVNRLLNEPSGAPTPPAIVTLNLQGRIMQAELNRLPSTDGAPSTLAIMLYPEEKATPQSQMIVSLIEELRTPLTSISGYTGLLLNEAVGILGEMQRQFLRRVQANVERMGKMLDDLLRITVLDSGQFLLSPEPVNMTAVIENAIMSLSAEFSERNLTVELDIPTELTPVHADRDSLHQIMLNLLSNACRCSRNGAEIVVSARRQTADEVGDGTPGYLLVSVTDAGGGIAPEDQARVFQRMYRADNPLIEGLGETGVGLSIAKALVEAHGGRMWVESEPPNGSTFSFILPLSSQLDGGQQRTTTSSNGGSRGAAESG